MRLPIYRTLPRRLFHFVRPMLSPWALIGLVIGALALALRLWHIDFGLPQRLHPDEWSQVETAWHMAAGDPNPHFFRYPTFFMDLLAFLFLPLKVAWDSVPLPTLYLIGRSLSAAFGTATVLVVYAWGLGCDQILGTP